MKKICFIGACGHVKHAYRVMKERNDVSLCGIAPFSQHENMAASPFEDVPLYYDHKAMLDECSPDIAVVSPVYGLTGKAIIECAERGIDVFSEKPVASTLDELELVKAAVKKSDIRFCAMHYLRYSPAFYRGAKLVKNGEIGDIVMITAQKSYKYGKRPEWYSDRALYGGTIPWVGIHAIDWIYHFSGKRFLSVSAESFGESPEMAAVCRFSLDGGIPASVNIDYFRPGSAPTHGDDRIRCVGCDGVLEIIDGEIRLINKNGCTVEKPTDAPELLSNFLDGKNVIDPDEIFYITKAAILARDSADSGKALYFNEDK